MNKYSITDIPKDAAQRDKFGIEPFEKGLIKFITNTSTPITIALQGEWGSGKTSLMNSLRKNLSEGNDSRYHAVWLNTWEYALMKDAGSTLIDIVTKLIDEVSGIANIDKEKKNKLISNVKKIGFSALKVASSVNSYTKATVEEIEKSFNHNHDVTISQIRDDLEKIIEGCLADKKNENKEGFIFFIDDLDRIDPPVAVQLLEILKNIFTLKNCVFVLAIDYDVVIKGLEPKFGKLSAKNEREFRSFFDKIIQVPFSMPVTSYQIDEFLKDSLLSIQYINETQTKNVELISKFSEIANITVGTNPRALKRLLNSISLISCINSTKGLSEHNDDLNDDLELLINFALVSIQIAYPQVYRLLSLYSGFDKWNENIALQMNLKPLDQQSIDKLNMSKEFDEDWEKVLFRLCENDYYLKKNALNISRLLNSIKAVINEKDEEVEDVIGAIISLSSVTNLEAFDKPIVDYHRGYLLKQIREKLLPALRKKLPNYKDEIKQKGNRVQTNLRFLLNGSKEYIMNSYPKDGKIILRFNTAVLFGKLKDNFKSDLKTDRLFDEFEVLANEYTNYFKANSPIVTHDLFNVGIWKNDYFVNFYSDYLMNKPEDFYKDESIEIICNHIVSMNEFRMKMEALAKKRINK